MIAKNNLHYFWSIGVIFTLITMIAYIFSNNIINSPKSTLSNDVDLIDMLTNLGKEITNYSEKNQFRNCEKFVILTSINDPTEHVKYINDALVDWCLVVVGDSKTPKNYEYKHLIYLDTDYQSKVLAQKYKIVSKIPFKSYLRKMVGYLYAIDLGAKYIYETDDDNAPEDGLFNFRYKTLKGLEIDCEQSHDSALFTNPYSFFGQPTVWPRGYPLERISNQDFRQVYGCIKFKVYSDTVPLIQQGLVNGDPDVDAIYRLTRKYYQKNLDIKFDQNAPALVLNRNQYAPVNSQNTFFHYDAFWSLVFPLNVTFRECDILRGYIAIRLMQEIEGRVGFIRPNAFQLRNAHSYHKDYLEEKRLFSSIEQFVKDLDEWKCDKDRLDACLIECVENLVSKGHLTKVEVDFYAQWIEDLNALKYKWPTIKRNLSAKKNEKKIQLIYKAIEQKQSSNSNENQPSLKMLKSKSSSLCPLIEQGESDRSIKDIVLITKIDDQSMADGFFKLLRFKFNYFIICTTNNNLFEPEKLNNKFGFLILFMKETETFENCVQNSFDIGFRPQSFLIFKDSSHILPSLDVDSFQFQQANSIQESDLDNFFYFVRRNVANGIRKSKIVTKKLQLEDNCRLLNGSFINSALFKAIETLRWHSNDLAAENCQNLPTRTVWIPDFHDGPRVDLSSTLVYLGQNSVLAGSKLYSSPYAAALKMSKVSNQLSPYVNKYKSVHPVNLHDSDARDNFDYYKKSSDFEPVDLVICSFPSAFCEAFIPLNKTIIFNPAHRYNMGKCSQQKWLKLNENYDKLHKKNKLVISAMSRYDLEYHTHFVDSKPLYRLYAYGGFYARNIHFNPIRDEILVGPSNGMGAGGKKILNSIKQQTSEFTFKKIREVYPRYGLGQLANHRAIVIFPYAVMSYSIIDFYISNIPIFVPSIELMNEHKMASDRTINSTLYCLKNKGFQDINPTAHGYFHHFSPNDDSDLAYKYWLAYADYFIWPHVTVFNSAEDLIQKLKTLDFKSISDKMKAYNAIRETSLLDNWCRIIKKVEPNQPIPESFEKSLQYFNLSNIY